MDPETIKAAVAHGADLKWFYVRLAAWFPVAGLFAIFLFHRFLDWAGGLKFRALVARVQGTGSVDERTALIHYVAARWIGSCVVLAASLIMLGLVLAS